ncbi:MAG: hypothetical protein ABIM96_01480 [Candidatus Saccharimonas sp.]
MENYPSPNTPTNSILDEPEWLDKPEVSSKPPRKSRRIIVIILGILVILGISLYLVFANATTCLTGDDYSSLTDETPPEDLNSKTSFYSTTFYFQDESKQLNPDTASEHTDIISKIAKFYLTHDQKPIIVTLSALSSQGTTDIASSRLSYLASLLTQQGIPASVIVTDIESYKISDEDELPESINMVGLSLNSAETCR